MDVRDFHIELLLRLEDYEVIKNYSHDEKIAELYTKEDDSLIVTKLCLALQSAVHWLLDHDEIKSNLLLSAKEYTGVSLPRSVATDTIVFVGVEDTPSVKLYWENSRYKLKVAVTNHHFLDLERLTDNLLWQLNISTGEIFNGSDNRRCRVPTEPEQ